MEPRHPVLCDPGQIQGTRGPPGRLPRCRGVVPPRWRASPRLSDPRHPAQTLRARADHLSTEGLPLLRLQPPQSSEKMATLGWKFDPGPSSQWKDLNADQLAGYAYKYLENALEDPIFRDHLRLAITTGSYVELVANVEDPLPALPPAPTTDHFGPPLSSPNIFHDKTYFYFNYERPSVTMRPGMYSQNRL